MSDIIEVEIEALGAAGDGIAQSSHGRLYIPLTVPGDRVRARLGKRRGEGFAAEVVERLADGAGRADPPCPHFGTCGGCALQHLAADPYSAWIKDRVVIPMARQGLDTLVVGAPLTVPPGSRRRARFAVRRGRDGVSLGFRERRSNSVVAIETCPVLEPAIVTALPALVQALGPALAECRAGDVQVTATGGSLDVLIEAAREPSMGLRSRLAEAAARLGLARLSWQVGRNESEPIAALQPVQIGLSGVAVDLPAGAFLQPTAAGEAALVSEAVTALAGARRVADLFAGCGPFTFALAAGGAHVSAFESDPDMVAALNQAARDSGMGERVTASQRDLARQPLVAADLKRLDGLLLDPPRAGASDQARQLADTGPPIIVYASCNPASFARDARMLVDGGYGLEKVVPVGQFLWSAEVELVSVFRRG